MTTTSPASSCTQRQDFMRRPPPVFFFWFREKERRLTTTSRQRQWREREASMASCNFSLLFFSLSLSLSLSLLLLLFSLLQRLTERFLEHEPGHLGDEVLRRARGGAELVSHGVVESDRGVERRAFSLSLSELTTSTRPIAAIREAWSP